MGGADKAFKVEKEKKCFTLADKFFNIDFIPDRVSGLRQTTMKCYNSIKQPVCSFAFYDKIDAQIRAQKQISLARFD